MAYRSIFFYLGNVRYNGVTLDHFIYRVTKEKESNIRFHEHNAYELHFILSGSGNIVTENTDVILYQGDAVLLGRNKKHLLKKISEEELQTFNMRFNFSLDSKEHDVSTPNDIEAVLFKNDKEMRTIIELIINEDNSIDPLRSSAISSYISLLVIRFIRLCPFWQNKNVRLDVDQAVTSLRVTSVIDSFFYSALEKDKKVEDLASSLNISCRQLHRILYKYYGMSYREKLLDVRLSVARDLLLNSSMSVTDVAKKCGYSYISNFTSSFIKKYGYSPSYFRNNNFRTLKG